MRLAAARIVGLGPIADLTFRFTDDDARARAMTCVLGGGGVGKTSLLHAIASTRPGYTAPLGNVVRRGRGVDHPPYVVADWIAGDDDPSRPHPLRLVTPGASLEGEAEPAIVIRRREAQLFDGRAAQSGFVLVAFAGYRWFSRAPLVIADPERTLLRHEARNVWSFDDATRADLGRGVKQVLAYAGITAALGARSGDHASTRLDAALRAAMAPLLQLAHVSYLGVDSTSLEPTFTTAGGTARFDELPTGVRQLVAFAALPLRAIHAAYPGTDPRAGEASILIDDVEMHLDPAVLPALAAAMKEALPRAQWIVTASSRAFADGCETSEVLALRQMPEAARVELFAGDEAVVH